MIPNTLSSVVISAYLPIGKAYDVLIGGDDEFIIAAPEECDADVFDSLEEDEQDDFLGPTSLELETFKQEMRENKDLAIRCIEYWKTAFNTVEQLKRAYDSLDIASTKSWDVTNKEAIKKLAESSKDVFARSKFYNRISIDTEWIFDVLLGPIFKEWQGGKADFPVVHKYGISPADSDMGFFVKLKGIDVADVGGFSIGSFKVKALGLDKGFSALKEVILKAIETPRLTFDPEEIKPGEAAAEVKNPPGLKFSATVTLFEAAFNFGKETSKIVKLKPWFG